MRGESDWSCWKNISKELEREIGETQRRIRFVGVADVILVEYDHLSNKIFAWDLKDFEKV